MTLFRPNIERMAGYMPGEQPQDSGWVKLNTNENPYPPSPCVVDALAEAIRGPLNLYPDPLGTRFREAVARQLGLEPDWVLPANGSDENLTLILRAFVDTGDVVAYPYPSYILYETLAEIQGGDFRRLLLKPDWSWDHAAIRETIEKARVVLIPNPNSPSGNLWSTDDLLRLVPPRGVLVVDEAYADFSDASRDAGLLRQPGGERIIITRTFSKSYSLAGVRFGFALAHPDLIAGMRKVKDSYNCDRLSLAAATAALDDQAWMQANADRVRTTRTRLTVALTKLGFAVVPSQANFVWCTHSTRDNKAVYETLKARKILVRYMVFRNVPYAPNETLTGLRVSIGTDAEIDALLEALEEILSQTSA